MFSNLHVILIIPLFVLISAQYEGIAVIQPLSGNNVSGIVRFYQTTADGNVTVEVNLAGFQNQVQVAIHIHEYGDLTSADGNSAGSHYVGQGSTQHACPPSSRHEGDMGSWNVTDNSINLAKTFDLLTLNGGYSIIGRAVVVHTSADSCSGTSGNAGSRIGYGVIGITFGNNGASNNATSVTNLVAVLQGTPGCPESSCNGYIWLQQLSSSDTITITANFPNLTSADSHGLHIHTYGDISVNDGSLVGSHYNPTGNNHNLPPSEPRHEGDLGNVDTYTTSGAWYSFNDTYFSSLSNFIGRAVVLHLVNDKGNGQGCDASGNSGVKIAIGVLGIQQYNYTYSIYPQIPKNLTFNNNWQSEKCTPDVESRKLGWIVVIFIVIILILGIACCIKRKNDRV